MPDDGNNYSKVWSIEEIDALLNDSGTVTVKENNDEQPSGKTKVFAPVREDSVDPRPTHSEAINHNIKTQKIVKTVTAEFAPVSSGGVMSDRYSAPSASTVRHISRTAEIARIGEHGDESGKAPSDAPSESKAEEKTLVRADGTTPEPTVTAKESDEDEENVAGQIKLEGFEDEEPAVRVDEEKVENELSERRKKEVERFFSGSGGVLGGEQPAEETPEKAEYTSKVKEKLRRPEKKREYVLADEYRSKEDVHSFVLYLSRRLKSTVASLALQIFSFLLITVLCMLPSFNAGIYTFEAFGSSERLFIVFVALAALIGAVSSKNSIINGAKSLIGLKPDTDSCLTIIWAAVGIQLVLMLLLEGNALLLSPVYAGVASAASALKSAGELLNIRRMRDNFRFITGCKTLSSVSRVSDKDEAKEIGKGLLIENPDIRVSVKAEFPEGFREHSEGSLPSDELCSRLVLFISAAAVLIGVAVGIVLKNALLGYCAFTAAVCIGMPVTGYLSDTYVLRKASLKLLSKGGMLAGFDSVNECAGSNAVALDAAELLNTDACSVNSIKTFHSMRVDEAILYSAALIIEAKAPLSSVFEEILLGRSELLPPVESVAYEDKLGLSAWIHNRRVLVGTRDLLNNHNVTTPDREFEQKYIHDGQCPLYLAIEGKIAAMFIVSYEPRQVLIPLLRSVERNGLTLLVKTSDANITEDLVCSSLHLPHSSTKILNAVGGDVFDECRSHKKPSVPATLLHDGSTESMFRTLICAYTLKNLKPLMLILSAVGSAVGTVFVTVLAFVSGLPQAGSIKIILYQLFWVAVSAAVIYVRQKRFR